MRGKWAFTLLISITVLLSSLTISSANTGNLDEGEDPAPRSGNSPARSPEDWSQFGGDPSHTSTFSTQITRNGELSWQRPLGGRSWSPPAVVNGTIYAVTDNSSLKAFDMDLGTVWWEYPVAGVWGTPAVVDDRIFLATVGSQVICLDRSSGQEIWKMGLGQSLQGSPVVSNDRLFISTVKGSTVCLSTQGNGSGGGEELWNRTFNWTTFKGQDTPACHGERVYIGTHGFDSLHHLICLNMTDGKTVWDVPTLGGYFTSSVVDENTVYIGTIQGVVEARSRFNGSLMWNVTLGGPIWGSPALSQGVLYVGCHDQYLYALDAPTGQQLWKRGASNAVVGSPAVSGNTILFSSMDKSVYALNRTGHLIWRYGSSHRVYGGPIASDKRVVFITHDNATLYVLGAPDMDFFPQGISLSDNRPYRGEVVTLKVSVRNNGHLDASTRVRFYYHGIINQTDVFLKEIPVDVKVGETVSISHDWRVDASNVYLWANITGTTPLEGELHNNVNRSSVMEFPIYIPGQWPTPAGDMGATGHLSTGPTMNATAWTHRFNEDILPSISVSHGLIYAAASDGLRALDENPGFDFDYTYEEWNHTTSSELVSSPSIYYDKLLLITSSGEARALEPLTGKLLWNRTIGIPANGASVASSGVFATALDDGSIIGLDEDNGEILWKTSTIQNDHLGLCASDDLVFSSSTKTLRALDPLTGQIAWSVSDNDGKMTAPALLGDRLIFGRSGKLSVVVAQSGKTLWDKDVNGDISFRPTLATTMNGSMVISVIDGETVSAHDLNTGAPRWSMEMDEPIKGRPVVSSSDVYIRTGSRKVCACPIDPGNHPHPEVDWEHVSEITLKNNLALANGVLLLTRLDRTLVALGAPNQPPVPKISAPVNGTSHFADDDVLFNASGTFDEEIVGLSFTWVDTSNDQVIFSGSSPSFNLAETGYVFTEGTHQVRLMVTDAEGLSANTTVSIVIWDKKISHFPSADAYPRIRVSYGGNGAFLPTSWDASLIPTNDQDIGQFVSIGYNWSYTLHQINWMEVYFNFTENDMHDFQNPQSLGVYQWSLGKWVPLTRSHVDVAAGVVWANISYPDLTNPIQLAPGTFSNNRPVLTEASVLPDMGGSEDSFELGVIYTDADGSNPGIVQALIERNEGDLIINMEMDTNSQTDPSLGIRYTGTASGWDLGDGEHRVTFRASDGSDGSVSDYDPVYITVLGNNPPLARFNATSNNDILSSDTDQGNAFTAFPGETIVLDATGSSDPDGDDLLFSWDMDMDVDQDQDGDSGNDQDSTAVQEEISFDRPGLYRIRLTVSDGRLSDTAEMWIEVTEEDSGDDDGGIDVSGDNTTAMSLIIMFIIIFAVLAIWLTRKRGERDRETFFQTGHLPEEDAELDEEEDDGSDTEDDGEGEDKDGEEGDKDGEVEEGKREDPDIGSDGKGGSVTLASSGKKKRKGKRGKKKRRAGDKDKKSKKPKDEIGDDDNGFLKDDGIPQENGMPDPDDDIFEKKLDDPMNERGEGGEGTDDEDIWDEDFDDDAEGDENDIPEGDVPDNDDILPDDDPEPDELD